MFDAIIIGSGTAGTCAAYALRGRNVLMLDVGYKAPPVSGLDGNFYALRQSSPDLFDVLIGKRFESLHNIHMRSVSLKLKAPHTAFVIQNWEQLSPLRSTNFDAVMSFAQGGLANAWGAGVYRFNAKDLEGFPITSRELEPFYDELTRHIGVSGETDDLEPYFGSDKQLLPPLRLSRLAADLLRGYAKHRGFFHGRGIFIGYPRLAVLTGLYQGRAPYRYDNLEFFRPYNPAIYNPVFTLDKLIEHELVQYKRGYLALRYQERDTHVEVIAKRLSDGTIEVFESRSLLLAAGTLNTTRLVLQSSDDHETRLPILDNPMSCVPFFRLSQIGAALDVYESSLAQLNVIYEGEPACETVQATLYGTTGPLRSDIIFDLPLCISANLVCAKYLAPAMGLLMVFYPAKASPCNYIKLNASGELEVNYEAEPLGVAERHLIKAFRRIGYFSAPALCRYPPMGSSLHYAGTLPMKEGPGPYQTDRNGRLSGTKGVYVVDGACFTRLPAKNLTFTIMANAMRIATRLRDGCR